MIYMIIAAETKVIADNKAREHLQLHFDKMENKIQTRIVLINIKPSLIRYGTMEKSASMKYFFEIKTERRYSHGIVCNMNTKKLLK